MVVGKLAVAVSVENTEGKVVREARMSLVPASEPGKHHPVIAVQNHETGFVLETKLSAMSCESFSRFFVELEERVKSPDAVLQAEKLFQRLAGLMAFMR